MIENFSIEMRRWIVQGICCSLVVPLAVAIVGCSRSPDPSVTEPSAESQEKTLEYEGVVWRWEGEETTDREVGIDAGLMGDIYRCDDPSLRLIDLHTCKRDRESVWKRVTTIQQLQDNGTWKHHGLYSSWLNNGSYATLEYQNGLLHGQQLEYYADGQIGIRRDYVNGQRHGHAERWYENGQKWAEGEMVFDQEDGPWKTWYEDGTLMSESLMSIGVELNSRWLYYEEGRLVCEIEYDRGVEISRREWDADGNEIP